MICSRANRSRCTIKDQLVGATKRIRDLHKKGTGLRWECLSRRPARAGEKQEVLRAGLTSGVDHELDSVDPRSDVRKIVGLVHDTTIVTDINIACGREAFTGILQNDAVILTVFRRQLRPDRRKLLVGRTTLTDDLTVPTSVVMLSYCGLIQGTV